MRTFARWTLAVAGTLVLGGVAQAAAVEDVEDAEPIEVLTDAAAAPVEPAAAAQPAMSPEQLAAMERMKTLGAPGAAHQTFDPLVGTWSYTCQFWMAPDQAPQTMTGTSTNALILGGRFLKQKIAGQMPDGAAFEGLGFLGYDNLRQEYQSLWIDNMMTGMMIGKGQFDAATATLTDSGTMSCPMTGETDRWYRAVWRVVDADHTVYESYTRAPDGQEFKSMEIQYTRVP